MLPVKGNLEGAFQPEIILVLTLLLSLEDFVNVMHRHSNLSKLLQYDTSKEYI